VHVPNFFEELIDLEKKGLENVCERIFISDTCHVVTDLHMRVDGLEEWELSGNSIGTTKRGIGPC
jgi:adenylosuccinate synthase